MGNNMPREMTGAELKSMLKSSINLKSLGGVKSPGLKLSKEDIQWWRDAKIGMFVHWGLYSILGRGEWAYFNEQIPKEEYESLADEFNPKDFKMTELTGLAKDLGAKYMIMVTKHHDGFSLWDSPSCYEGFTSYNTASKRDFVKEYVDACREAGLRVGLYYSPMDWRFPGYFDPEGKSENARLMKQQCYGQVEELCSRYGPIDIMWYDGAWLAHKGSDTSSAWFWEPVKLNKIVRKYNPKTMINPRSGWEGDFYCDEGSHEMKGNIIPVPWEKNMCICSGSSWGWMENDPVSSFEWLIKMLVDVVCRDGNLLLNVGPDKNGKLSKEVTDRVREIGDWLRKYGESIYGTRGGPIQPSDNVYGTTYKNDTIYLHVLDTQKFMDVTLPSISENIIACTTFNGEKCEYRQNKEGIKIRLPKERENEVDTILKLKLDKEHQQPKEQEIYFTGKE
ncbi:alpha-L-fucosidase [Blautia liquoris]|uniref:alpha-L-fucosidase n=1 Tax=Blautia liquoris TaxID=2779518 RepID=A0A7M2RJ17_9FIRM|nr:alpha-L-fucosidase [Blautia liquoris]QOV20249.1 alpha-L-fucosidase [Blautia liquoris]